MEDVKAEDLVEVDDEVEEVEAVVIVIIIDVAIEDDDDAAAPGLRVLTKNLRNILALSLTSSGEVVDKSAASFAKAEMRRARSSSVLGPPPV